MKTLETQLNQIKDLRSEAKRDIHQFSKNLRASDGAEIRIDSTENEIIKVSVSNINGKRSSKYHLYDTTYHALSKTLPEHYRLIIKV